MAIKNKIHHANHTRLRALLLSLGIASLVSQFAHADCQGMLLHAHRGSPAAAENSLTSVKLAFDGEWDGAEIDIQQLRDRQWVLHHDPVLGRTTSLQGHGVRDLDSTTWREVRLKDRQGKVVNEPAPFLNDLLQEIPERDDKVLNIEIKQFNGSCDAAQLASAVLHKGLPQGRWFLTSVDRRQLQCVRKVDGKGYLGLIVLDGQALARENNRRYVPRGIKPPVLDSLWLKRLLQEVGSPVGIHIDINTLTANPNVLADAKAMNMAVFSYHLGPDREHVNALKAYSRRTGLLPSGAIIDSNPSDFCNLLGRP